MERWLTNPGQDNNQVPNYLPIGKRITRPKPIAERYENGSILTGYGRMADQSRLG
jgi:hypothetical protein